MSSTSPRIRTLKTVVFMGSDRDVQPAWGPFLGKRLGDRVLTWVKATLAERRSNVGADVIKHDVTVFDPHEVFGPEGALHESGAGIRTPVHFLGADATEKQGAMMAAINDADCFIVVSPEYNHSIPPALSGLMGHFPSQGVSPVTYASKPSAIVTYSMGPWGGMRTAMALRPFLSELGCVPVNRLCGIPTAHELFGEDGTPTDPEHRMLAQLPSMLNQLEWFAVALANQRAIGLPN